MKNAVSSRLSERTATEIAEAIYRPGMATFDGAALEAMCQVNEAHIVMLLEQGLMPLDIARPLASAIGEIRKQGVSAVDLDPQFEDSYFAFEGALARVAGAKVTGFLHTGRSRNDLGSTLDRMLARSYALRLITALNAARKACENKALEQAGTIMPGYTHLQPAQPITLGYFLTNVAAALSRETDKLLAAYERLNRSTLGSAAFAGTTFPVDRTRTAELLGFDGFVEPCLEAVGSRDFVVELLSCTTSALTVLSRVANDMYVFATSEFALITFPDRVAGTSSIMPQKKNLLALEYLRASAGRSIGALAGTLASLKGSNYSIGLDSVREGIGESWAAFDLFIRTMDVARVVFEGITPNHDRLENLCRQNFSTATDLADGLVREFGLSFREAHHVVGGAVQHALNLGLDAAGMTAEIVNESAREELGRDLPLTAEFIRDHLDPVRSVNSRTTPGGTAPSEVRRMLGTLALKREKDVDAARQLESKLDKACNDLAQEIDRIVSETGNGTAQRD